MECPPTHKLPQGGERKNRRHKKSVDTSPSPCKRFAKREIPTQYLNELQGAQAVYSAAKEKNSAPNS